MGLVVREELAKHLMEAPVVVARTVEFPQLAVIQQQVEMVRRVAKRHDGHRWRHWRHWQHIYTNERWLWKQWFWRRRRR